MWIYLWSLDLMATNSSRSRFQGASPKVVEPRKRLRHYNAVTPLTPFHIPSVTLHGTTLSNQPPIHHLMYQCTDWTERGDYSTGTAIARSFIGNCKLPVASGKRRHVCRFRQNRPFMSITMASWPISAKEPFGLDTRQRFRIKGRVWRSHIPERCLCEAPFTASFLSINTREC